MISNERYEKLKLRTDLIQDIIAKDLPLEKLQRLKAIILEDEKQ